MIQLIEWFKNASPIDFFIGLFFIALFIRIIYESLNQNKMAVTIIEALQNAKLNLDNTNQVPILTVPLVNLAKEQLNNSIVLLEKGYDIWTEIEPLIDKYGDIENVPDLSNV